ncbi:MAG: hypothetical protein ABFD90_19480 [Phycisphaerales bacterium]
MFASLGLGFVAWAVHATFSSGGASTGGAESHLSAPTLLGQLSTRIEPTLGESRRILLGQRPANDPTCITRNLKDGRVLLPADPAGGAGLRIMAAYGDAPDAPMALYHWSQETFRPILQAEQDRNTSALAKAEELAALAMELASRIRETGDVSVLQPVDDSVASPAWPAECLRRLESALATGNLSSSKIWAEELAAATFALADLHRWLDVLLSSHLASLDFQARCRTAFTRMDSTEQEGTHLCLPAAGQMIAWGENYLEVEHQSEGLFRPSTTAVTLGGSLDLSRVPAARWMPPDLREAFLSLRSHLSPAIQAVWDQAAAMPFERTYLANMLFRNVSCNSLAQLGLVLERFDRSHETATVAELMDVLFYRAGLHSSGFPWSARYDSRILDAAGAISADRELTALRAQHLANSLLKGWANYAGGLATLSQALDTGKFDCVSGTDLIGALYRNAGQGEYFVVRLNCGTIGHSVGAVPVERDGERQLLILDSLNPLSPSGTWPSAYFHGLAWPQGYPGNRGLLLSAELYARGLDGYVFSEGYVVRGENAGQWVRVALPYLPGCERADCVRVFAGPYPPISISDVSRTPANP